MAVFSPMDPGGRSVAVRWSDGGASYTPGHQLLPLRSATLGGELVGMDNAVVIACAARRPAVTYAGSRA